MSAGKETRMGTLSLAGKTDVGLVRKNNEDTFISRKIWDGKWCLAAVIDGIGGYEGGEVASSVAEREICSYLEEFNSGNPGRLLAEAVNSANNAIFEERKTSEEYSRMGCVLTAVLTDGKTLYTAHVGDTRLYLARKGRLVKLTHDHSLVGYREEIGDLSEEEAMNHPMRNVISRDLGESLHNHDDEDWIETSCLPIHSGDILLLCSDGLSDLVTSKEMSGILFDGKSLAERAGELIGKALSKGGKDNVTVVLVERDRDDDENEIQVETVGYKALERKTILLVLAVSLIAAAVLFFILKVTNII